LIKMNILLAYNGIMPVYKYGGTPRDIWYLGRELVRMGHKVSYLVAEGSYCDFAEVLYWDNSRTLNEQVPGNTDIVNPHYPFGGPLDKPYVASVHGNRAGVELSRNTTFVSRDHARRFNAEAYVYNGMDWDDYGEVNIGADRKYFHFLGKAAWRIKNLKGAIRIIQRSKGERLKVLGGKRLNFKMGFRLTVNPRVSFAGMVGGEEKYSLLQKSKGLIFPVRWHEPFGLAITESLYFGCPVFGTPYGSLPELVTKEFGFLSNRSSEIIEAIKNSDLYSRQRCHEYAKDVFNSKKMAEAYLKIYEKVLNGEQLNPDQPRQMEDIHTLPWVD
jgi:glycosyltransferase involved in cell wall biosynthesis